MFQQTQQQHQHQHQHQQQEEDSERGNQRSRIMDLRNLCQRLNVDNLKAKLPTLPQLKLPKSFPKLHGARRIFRTSRENVSGAKAAPTLAAGLTVAAATEAAPHAQFINRTPQRISTISSLMHEQAGMGAEAGQDRCHLQPPNASTYRSAGSLDDDYYAPYGTARVSRPISPIKMPPPAASGPELAEGEAGGSGNGVSLSQRLQRGYKSLSELRLKHLFAKQTVVRRDGIEVQHYVEQYEAERRVEQVAQAKRDSEIADNYNIEIRTLPLSRQNTLEQAGEDGDGDREEDVAARQLQHKRSVAEHSGDESGMEATPTPPPAATRKKKKSGIAASRFAKVRQPPLQMPVEQQAANEEEEQQTQQRPTEPAEQPMRQAVRQNLKRIRKSIKRIRQPSRHSVEETDEDEQERGQEEARPKGNASSNLRARLRRFTSTEQLQQRWRKSFKSSSESAAQAESEPQRTEPSATGEATGMAAQLERTLTKLNERMQQLKFFQRHADRGNAKPTIKPNTVGHEPVEIDDEELAGTYHHTDSSDSDDSGRDICAAAAFGQREELQQQHLQLPEEQQQPPPRSSMSTAWSSESLEEDGGGLGEPHLAADYPRVLIHQQHTDAYESTIIIAVTTTPPKRSCGTSWVPNEQIIAGFKEQQAVSGTAAWPAPSIYKSKSIDIFESDGGAAAAFADFDEALRHVPVLRISAESSYDEDAEDAEDDSSSRVTKIRVQTPRIGNSCESLMEQQPLEDDEDNGIGHDDVEDMEDEYEDDEDEYIDDDGLQAQQLLKLEKQQQQQQQLQEQVKAIEEQLKDSERPPSASPPPPPLPLRRPPAPPTAAAPIYDAVPPPLPISKPPTVATAVAPALTALPPLKLPLRSASMTRPAKPLVKTSSLRLTYKEQMHPEDVGKVNKLISRFEGRPRLCARRLHSEELTICSDEEDELLELVAATPEDEQLLLTPTNAVSMSHIPNIITTQPSNDNNNNNNNNNNPVEISVQAELSLGLDRQNSNCSRSEYGSPLSYSRSATPTMATTGQAGRPLATQQIQIQVQNQTANQTQSLHQNQSQTQLLQARRSRRSMTRDDDNFYSFDSDEENSYYSISPSSSSRYVVEI